MKMTYGTPGSGTSAVEVTNVSEHGFWLLLHEKELFLPFASFPWFRDASIGKIVRIELVSDQHLYWPDLDIDLELDAILHPERYPLVSKIHEPEERYAVQKPATVLDQEKIDDSVLALLQLTLHDGHRAWKGFDFDVMERLFEKGYIFNPRGKSKSVALTASGLQRSKELFEELFEKHLDEV